MSVISRMCWLVTSVFTAGLTVISCSSAKSPLAASQREAIQTRVTNTFANTVLFKPAESGASSNHAVRLAPLIVQELADTNPASLWRGQFESDAAGPLVHFQSGTITVNGRLHNQFSYVWSYSSDKSARKMQGVRLTLNAAGEPVIWEVLGDSTGADIIYVAQSLELAARAEFGAPLHGRKYSIERSLEDAPNTVVANVIDDGPVPMGPVVYLLEGSRDVSTLICRCMASQGGMLLGQTNHALQPIVPSDGRPTTFPRAQLEQRLRLPRSF